MTNIVVGGIGVLSNEGIKDTPRCEK